MMPTTAADSRETDLCGTALRPGVAADRLQIHVRCEACHGCWAPVGPGWKMPRDSAPGAGCPQRPPVGRRNTMRPPSGRAGRPSTSWPPPTPSPTCGAPASCLRCVSPAASRQGPPWSPRARTRQDSLRAAHKLRRQVCGAVLPVVCHELETLWGGRRRGRSGGRGPMPEAWRSRPGLGRRLLPLAPNICMKGRPAAPNNLDRHRGTPKCCRLAASLAP